MNIPDSKVHGANMGPTWVLPVPDGHRVGPLNLAIRDDAYYVNIDLFISPGNQMTLSEYGTMRNCGHDFPLQGLDSGITPPHGCIINLVASIMRHFRIP